DLLQYASRYPDARGLLFDAFVAGGMPGGTGRTFDWQALATQLDAGLARPATTADRTKASRTRRRSPRSSEECVMQMADIPYALPDERGHFGPYGGVFVAETLIHALDELREQYARYRTDPEFVAEFEYELKHYVGRPSPVYHASRWSERLGGAQLYFKREDLNHTGAHKINNCI